MNVEGEGVPTGRRAGRPKLPGHENQVVNENQKAGDECVLKSGWGNLQLGKERKENKETSNCLQKGLTPPDDYDSLHTQEQTHFFFFFFLSFFFLSCFLPS